MIFLVVKLNFAQLEWLGGFPPVLTRHKTVPDYAAVEAHRARTPGGTNTESSKSVGSGRWIGFRGPDRNGIYTETSIRTNWPSGGLKPLWRQPIGGGYASFAIAEGMAFTIEQRRDHETVTGYSIADGRELWAQSYPAFFDESMGGEGPRASPMYDEGRVYSLGAAGEFLCLNATNGDVVWRKNILAENNAANLTWAQSASPLVVDDKVIVQPGGSGGKSVVAYNKISGAPVWSSLSDEAAYSSPMLVSLAGQRQLLVSVNNRVVGLRVEDGTVLWEFPWVVQMGNRIVAQPVVLGTNRVFLSAGYGTGCAAVEITRLSDVWSAREVWRSKSLKNKFTSSVFRDGHLYGLDEDVLVCIDAGTGVRQWKDGRYGYGQVLLAGDQLIVLCGEGDLAIVRAVPDRHEEVVRFSAITGKTWNHPSIAGGRLLVRNAVEMACFDLSVGGQ
jgi:outer membrane protein assembly factor BamB